MSWGVLGFMMGLIVATLITAITGLAVTINPDYIMSPLLDDIVIFVYPAHFAASYVTEINFSTLIFFAFLILINGMRYFMLFLFFGGILKFICRCLGWFKMHKLQQT